MYVCMSVCMYTYVCTNMLYMYACTYVYVYIIANLPVYYVSYLLNQLYCTAYLLPLCVCVCTKHKPGQRKTRHKRTGEPPVRPARDCAVVVAARRLCLRRQRQRARPGSVCLFLREPATAMSAPREETPPSLSLSLSGGLCGTAGGLAPCAAVAATRVPGIELQECVRA